MTKKNVVKLALEMRNRIRLQTPTLAQNLKYYQGFHVNILTALNGPWYRKTTQECMQFTKSLFQWDVRSTVFGL